MVALTPLCLRELASAFSNMMISDLGYCSLGPHQRSLHRTLFPSGLFFLDGEEWWTARRKLNPLFLKQQSLQRLYSVVEDNTEDLIGGWSCGDNIQGLEAQLYSWSTSTMLGTGDLRLEVMRL